MQATLFTVQFSLSFFLMLVFLFLFLFPLFFHSVISVDRNKFKTCSQSGFCNRHRSLSFSPLVSVYSVVPSSVSVSSSLSSVSASLVNTKFSASRPLNLTIQVLRNGIVRVNVEEKQGIHDRFRVKDVIMEDALQGMEGVKTEQDEKGQVIQSFNVEGTTCVVRLQMSPFLIEVDLNEERVFALNSRGLFEFEQYRSEKNPAPSPSAEDGVSPVENGAFPFDREGMWEETFGGHTDSKPRGPSAISLDFTFDGSEHLYGLPEHAAAFALKNTQSDSSSAFTEPYRLYNLDVFEYELNSPMALYGSIPFILSHTRDISVGLLWLNAAETFVDVIEGQNKALKHSKSAHFISESGIIDVFFFIGPKPSDVFFQYASLTGFGALPQFFAIGYHQCRWNYKDEADVALVDGGFDENDIPYDVLWLDIEHTDGKKYFTWDQALFPNPKTMQEKLAIKGRKMVTIVDPHTKRDSNYNLHIEATAQSLYVKTKQNTDYEGWCWPGSVSYLDFLDPKVRDFWADQFSFEKYGGSTSTLFTWNDMNEPSVFNGPEVTMLKDNLHLNGFEHRDVHNMYGFYQHMATGNGLMKRNHVPVRPFVLSRSFFAGSQRLGPIWTGDNKAEWSHLTASLPMLLSLNIAGYSFVGADVGGFFGNPDAELFVRWYQAGAYQPFYRGHAHIDAKRREPWLYNQDTTLLVRAAIHARYALLPYIYTAFFLNARTAAPVMRPIWSQYPFETGSFDQENQYLFGSDLLVHPITAPNQVEAHVYLPGSEPWYDIENWIAYASGQTVSIPAPLQKIPVFQRGGSIIARKERFRRSSKLMEHDPYTLVIALNNNSSAHGVLYLDDGYSFDYKSGNYMLREFSFSNGVLTASIPTCIVGIPGSFARCIAITKENSQFKPSSRIERIAIVGLKQTFASITLTLSGETTQLIFYKDANDRLIIRKPDMNIDAEWSIRFK